MKTVTLGNTGIKVSELGFGAMYLPRASVEESDKMIWGYCSESHFPRQKRKGKLAPWQWSCLNL